MPTVEGPGPFGLPAVPAALRAQAWRGPRWRDWLDRLPRLVAGVVDDWQLRLDGTATHGHCSLVLPVRTPEGRPAALKVALPDEESEHEHLALRHWAGRGAVELLRADPHRRALLLERLHTQDLTGLDALAACEVVAGLYTHLHRPAFPQLRPLPASVARWSAGLAALPRDAPLPRRLVEQALTLGRDLAADPRSTGTVVHTDLHYANVLAADRDAWLAIDPKPLDGDPHYEVAPLLWNRWEEVVASGDVRTAVRRRFHTVVDAAGLDEDRARDWVVVRQLHNALWTVQDAERAGRPLPADERAALTAAVAIAKAVQD